MIVLCFFSVFSLSITIVICRLLRSSGFPFFFQFFFPSFCHSSLCFVKKKRCLFSARHRLLFWILKFIISVFCLFFIMSSQMIETVTNVDNVLSQEIYCSHKGRGCRKTMLLSELEVSLLIFLLLFLLKTIQK